MKKLEKNCYSLNSNYRGHLFSTSCMVVIGSVILPLYAHADEVDNNDKNVVLVTGSIEKSSNQKQKQNVVVDSINFDDLETIAGDGYIAAQLIQLPGVSAIEDADSPRYITLRGVSSSLNMTTFDGVALATVGDSGSGDRRVNLQLLPSEITSQTDIYKTFTAEQDGGAIGGIIDIKSRDAFKYKKFYKNIDTYGIYSTYAGLSQIPSGGDTRKHWGGGIKANFAGTFGPNDQFGFVFSARHEERTRNSTKQWTEGIYYYDSTGTRVSNSQDEDWNGIPVSYSYNTADYANIITSDGGSLKLQWRSKDNNMHASILGYRYKRSEDSTMNKHDFYIKTSAKLLNQTDTSGTQLINSFYTKWRHDDWSRSAKGIIGNFDWSKDRSTLKISAGHSEEKYSNYEIYIGARAYPSKFYATYSWADPYDSLPQITSVTSTETTKDTSIYKTYKADYYFDVAVEKLDDFKADYSFNSESNDRGFGFATGFNLRDMNIYKDHNQILYNTGGSAASYLYVNNLVQNGTIVTFPWINYSLFASKVLPTLTVNTTNADYNNLISDYSYDEKIYAAYLSMHYQTDKWNVIIGERYDRAEYTANTPIDNDGVIASEWAAYKGKYDKFLPSINTTYKINNKTNLRFSYSKTLGRPTPANVAQAQKTSCGEDDSGADVCTITKGNPNLRPRRSDNIDLYLEHFLPKDGGVIAVGLFAKKIKDDIFTLTVPTEIDDVTYYIKQPMNADESNLKGAEFQFQNKSKFFGRKLSYGLNLTLMDGETNFVSDSGTRKVNQMLEQPKFIASANMSYYFPSIDGGINVNTSYRTKYYTAFAASSDDDDGRDDLQTVNMSFWYKILPHATLKYEFINIFNQQPKFLTGNNLIYRSEIDEYGRGVYLHLVIK